MTLERKASYRRFYRADSQADLTKFWDGGEHFAMQNRWCFECAWEVGNKVGGIYTVIRWAIVGMTVAYYLNYIIIMT